MIELELLIQRIEDSNLGQQYITADSDEVNHIIASLGGGVRSRNDSHPGEGDGTKANLALLYMNALAAKKICELEDKVSELGRRVDQLSN